MRNKELLDEVLCEHVSSQASRREIYRVFTKVFSAAELHLIDGEIMAALIEKNRHLERELNELKTQQEAA